MSDLLPFLFVLPQFRPLIPAFLLETMGSELCANRLEMEGVDFIPICVIPKVEEKNVTRFPQLSNSTFDLRPNSIGRHCEEQSLDLPCQAMLISSPPSVRCFDFNGNGSKTAKESIFDPFAPVHHNFTLAPPRKKCVEESRNNIVRRLNFSSSINFVTNRDQEAYDDDEQLLLDIVYSDLLEVFTSERTKEFASESLSQVLDSDGFCTPDFSARLSGIAETCPGAPKKSISKYRDIDKNLCRKLEY